MRCSCLRLRAVSEFDEEAFKPSQTQSISLPLSEQFRCCCCYLAMASIRASLNIYIYIYRQSGKTIRRRGEAESGSDRWIVRLSRYVRVLFFTSSFGGLSAGRLRLSFPSQSIPTQSTAFSVLLVQPISSSTPLDSTHGGKR